MIDHRIGKIKVRRGTDSQRKAVTFEEGELVYSIDKQRLYIGNSEEKGGILVSNRNYVKNSVGEPAVAPPEVLHGDIVYDKSNSRTYITKCSSLSCELILIADAGCCARLQIEINDLYDRLRTLMPCATTTPPPTPPPIKLTWYREPSDISVNLGETATFTASAIGGVGVINYKWNRKDGIPISVVDNQPTLTFTTQLSDESTYYCVANTFSETINSKDAVLSIGANSILAEDGTYILSELQEFIDWEVSGLLAPTIITHPRSQVTTTLVPVTFSVVAAGSAPLSYQWRLNGVDILGETGTSYTITNPTKDLTGITCYVSNSIGNVESNPASLSVGIKPTIVTQPVSQTVNTGSSVTFTVVAAGTNPLSYQWSKDGVVINGATSSTYTINTAQTSDQGNYSCLVSNIYGNIPSNLANLKIGQPPIIVTQPISIDQYFGHFEGSAAENADIQISNTLTNVSFSVIADSNFILEYKWYKNNIYLTGENKNTYTSSDIVSNLEGSYFCVVSNLFGSVSTNLVTYSYSFSTREETIYVWSG